MLAKEVAGAAKLGSSHASAQLRQLVEKGYAREVRLPGTKRARYEVSDRFYNIYYLLRFSRAGRDRLERLVTFLHDLFGPAGMRTMYPATLARLRGEGIGAGEITEWLGVLFPRVVRDRDFKQRVDWLCEAFELIVNRVDPGDPIIDRIRKEFPILELELMEKMVQSTMNLVKKRRVSDVMGIFRNMENRQSDGIFIRIVFGLALVQAERFSEAMDILEHVPEHVNLDAPDKSRIMAVVALGIKGLVLFQQEYYEDAISMLEQASECMDPDDQNFLRDMAALIHWLIGISLVKSGQHEQAITAWQRASDHVRTDDPENLRRIAADALKNKGDVLAKLGRHEEAVAAWERTTEYVFVEDPTKLRHIAVRALGAKGLALSRMEQYDDSTAAWHWASEYVRPDDPEETRQMVVMMLAVGSRLLNRHEKYGEAEAACRRATEIEPAHEESWRVLAEAILWQDDDARLPEAEECVRRAVVLAPENPRALHMLSDILARCGRWTEALDHLECALRVGGSGFQEDEWADLTESLIPAVAAGHGSRVKKMMEEAGLAEAMEPLWHAIRAELGEELEPLPTEIMETVTDLRQEFSDCKR